MPAAAEAGHRACQLACQRACQRGEASVELGRLSATLRKHLADGNKLTIRSLEICAYVFLAGDAPRGSSRLPLATWQQSAARGHVAAVGRPWLAATCGAWALQPRSTARVARA